MDGAAGSGTHRALIGASDEDLVDGTVAFVCAGLDAGEPVVVVVHRPDGGAAAEGRWPTGRRSPGRSGATSTATARPRRSPPSAGWASGTGCRAARWSASSWSPSPGRTGRRGGSGCATTPSSTTSSRRPRRSARSRWSCSASATPAGCPARWSTRRGRPTRCCRSTASRRSTPTTSRPPSTSPRCRCPPSRWRPPRRWSGPTRSATCAGCAATWPTGRRTPACRPGPSRPWRTSCSPSTR